MLVLVGNKVDLSQQRVVSFEQAQELATTLSVEYFETSAKDNTNVTQTVEHLVDSISDSMAATVEKNPHLLPRGVKPRKLEVEGDKAASGCAC